MEITAYANVIIHTIDISIHMKKCMHVDVNTVNVTDLKKGKMMKKTPVIYTITTIRSFLAGGCRGVGYAHTMEDANNWVVQNAFDINECGYYPYAVIEEVEEGIYSFPRIEHWYEYNKESDTYMPCEKPERYRSTVCWGLG